MAKTKTLAAARSNIAGDNDVSPILDLIEQGCDLDLDVLPTIARRVQRDSRRGARLSSLTFGRPLTCRLQNVSGLSE